MTTGPGCASLPSFFLPQLAQLPAPPSGAICGWLKGGALSTCNALAMLEYANGNPNNRNSASNTRCSVVEQIPPPGTPTPFADARPLPAVFANPTQQYQQEGETMYWCARHVGSVVGTLLWVVPPRHVCTHPSCSPPLSWRRLYRTIRNLENVVLCGGSPAFQAPDGWELTQMVNLTQPAGQPLPLIVLLTNAKAGQLAVIIRGTITSYEWALDFQYNQVQ